MSKDDKEAKTDALDASQEGQESKTNAGDDSAQDSEVDWQALAQKERERAEKAERDRDNYKEGMLSRDRADKRRRTENTDDEAEAEDKPITRKEIGEVLREAIAPLRSEGKLDSILSSLVTDPSKRDFVKELYTNRIQRTGTSDDAIRSDLETAIAIADSKRISRENAELKRMKDTRTYVPPTGGGGGEADRGTQRKAYEWTPEQQTALEERARSIGISDVEKYKERAWREVQSGTAFSVKPKPRA